MNETRKKYITEIVEAFKAKYPEEWSAAVDSVAKLKDNQATVYGSDKLKEMRFNLRLPARLMDILQKELLDPPFLKEDDENDWFMRTFKELTPAEKV